MAKRRALPDFREKSGSYPEKPDAMGNQWEPPASHAIAELATKHGFTDGDTFREQFVDCLLGWRWGIQVGTPPTGRARRRFLEVLAERAALLDEALTNAGAPERRRILNAAALRAPMDLALLTSQIRILRLSALTAMRNTPLTRAGRRGDEDTISLLCDLWRMYRAEFGSKAKRLTKNVDGYGGPFFEFARDVCNAAGIRKSNSGLGKAIEKAQASVEAANNRKLSQQCVYQFALIWE